ncbi:multidrug transporter [Altererythrobacter confluentis]|uniref:Multidrug transporter n=1 Tax=Allopontixanthobacter confluentis TaxID=1849021 RepID=A0A6L7GI69_9SPHN|nr:SapC family protein [Allopontixanthobacter confluentis]MXP14391.1 multidrug transporter [Allopontixanthobacter confluentis]
MASAPQPTLPLFYNDLMPLNSRDHSTWKTKPIEAATWLVSQHAIPLTVDEFVQAQRDYPIVFSSGDNPLPLALMGLNEGVNTFVDEQGKVNEPVYLPAYIRRYPFMLARLTQDAEELSLCFDPTTESLGEFEDGTPLFDAEGKPSEGTNEILQFCERFEEAGVRTKAFIDELTKHELLMDGEIAISQTDNQENPFVYRGFQMIDQEKLREVRGDVLRTWNQNGLMALIHAHLFSLDLMRAIFSRQVQQGKGPQLAAPAAAGPAA